MVVLACSPAPPARNQLATDSRHDTFLSRSSDISNPSLIIAVLSPATEAYDRGTKFSLYRSIPSLRDYILISQESATIDHFHKNDADQWILANDGHPDTLQLPHLDVSIPYAEIYANVEFEQ